MTMSNFKFYEILILRAYAKSKLFNIFKTTTLIKIFNYNGPSQVLCILISFRVLHALETWLIYFFVNRFKMNKKGCKRQKK